MKGSKFIVDGVDIFYYNLNKLKSSQGETYINTPKCKNYKKNDQKNLKVMMENVFYNL